MSTLRHLQQISFWQYVLLAFVVRLPAVFFSRGYEFIDAQFMYVDPAYGIAFDATWWNHFVLSLGMKSWIYPGFLAGVFRLSDAMGFCDANAMMVFTRAVHALVSLLPVIAFWSFLRSRDSSQPNTLLLVFFACNPLLVYSGVQPNAITFATGLALTAVFASQCSGRWVPFLGGVALGLAFACRFQDALFGPPILVVGLIQKRYRETLGFCLGCICALAVQGLVDKYTYGAWLHSPIAYTKYNLSSQAKAYGQQSMFLYLGIAVALMILVPPFLRSAASALRMGIARFPVLFACALTHFLVHNLIGRKAFRFVIPSMILLLVVFVAGLLAQKVELKSFARWHRRIFFGVQAVALVVLSFTYFHRGPIEAAVALSQNHDFANRLIVVDGGEESVGGFYYLRRKKLELELIPRAKLRESLASERGAAPLFLMVCNGPLTGDWAPDGWSFEELGLYQSWPRVSRRSTRHLYALRKPGVQGQ